MYCCRYARHCSVLSYGLFFPVATEVGILMTMAHMGKARLREFKW